MSRSCALMWLSLVCLFAGCSNNSGQKPESTQMEKASDINLSLGIGALSKGNLSLAKDKLDRSVEQNPRNAKAHAVAGLLYDRLEQPDKADTLFMRAISLDGEDPDILNNYAAFLCKNLRYERGEKFALQAARNPIYKTPEVSYMNAGNCAFNGGKLARAEEHYRKALSMRPRYTPALFRLAEVEFRQNNFLSSRAFIERYLQAAKPDPAVLLLAVRVERNLGNEALADSYAQRLKTEFPSAIETKELLNEPLEPASERKLQ